MDSKRTGALTFLIAILSGAVGLSAGEPVKLIYALPVSVPVALPYIAIDKGFFKEEGLDVEARVFSSGREALQALLSHQAQIQSVSETPIVHAIVQGNSIVTIATVAEHMEAKLIVRKDRGILKPADIKGKRLATLPGTNSDYFMYRFLRKHGLKLGDIHVTNMSPPEMIVAYAKGDIDGYFAWEPHIYYGRRQLPKESEVFYPGELYRGWSTVNMDPDFVRQNPETARKIIRALLKAEDFVRSYPEESIRLMAQRLKMDESVLASLWKENVFKVELLRGFPDQMKEIGRWALEQSKSERPLPEFGKYIYDKALAQERPKAVRL